MKAPVAAFSFSLLVAACSASSGGSPNGGSQGSATASGSVGGVAVGTVSALAQSYSQGGNGVWVVSVAIYGAAASCSLSPAPGATSVLGLYVENDPATTGQTAAPAGPSLYNVGFWGNGLAGGSFSGAGTGTTTAQSGTINLTTVTDTLVEGSFSLTFDSPGGTVSGSFSAPVCPRAM